MVFYFLCNENNDKYLGLKQAFLARAAANGIRVGRLTESD